MNVKVNHMSWGKEEFMVKRMNQRINPDSILLNRYKLCQNN